MTATVETFLKYDFKLTAKESAKLMTATLRMFNLILMIIDASKNENELKQSMKVMHPNLKPYFEFGFGAEHMWVHQKISGVISETRLLIVSFD